MPVKIGSEAYKRKLAKQNKRARDQRAAERAERQAALAQQNMAPVDPDRWRLDPIGWAEAALGVDSRTICWSQYGGAYETHEWDGDVNPLAKALEALVAGSWVAIESGKGIGKTFLSALATLWFLENFLPDPSVVSLAPKEKQLELNMWKQIGRFWPRFVTRRPMAKLKHLHLRMKSDDDQTKVSWAAWGYAAGAGAAEESATRVQGFHDENQLFVLEESPGIKPAIWTAVEETNTRPKTNLILAIGNPTHQLDSLHRFATSPGVVHIRASALDHPNVVLDNPDIMRGAVTRASIARLERKYGAGDPRFGKAVRGISPAEAADALIKLAWIQDAARRDVPDGASALGFDPSNSLSGDPAALARGRGARLLSVETFPCPDAGRMARERIAPLIVSGSVPAGRVGVDGIGVGAAAVSELLRIGHRIVNIQSGGGAVPRKGDVEEYGNLRAQMYDLLADDLQQGRVGGPGFADLQLQEELVAVKAGVRSGKTFIREKDKIRELLGRSPNKADAVVYWNWVRQGGAGRRMATSYWVGSW